jgi:hypothetical protein
LECAITLAGAAEEILPNTNGPHAFEIMRDHPTFKRIGWDWNEARNWLKHYDEAKPEFRTFHQSEAALIIYRAITKFAAIYDEMPNRCSNFSHGEPGGIIFQRLMGYNAGRLNVS